MSPSTHEYLRHMLDEIDYVTSQLLGKDFESFAVAPTLKRAFVRSLEIIGETAKKRPDDLKVSHPEIEWRKVTGIRDRLIHGYFGVDYRIVWDVATTKLPELREQLFRLLETVDGSPKKGSSRLNAKKELFFLCLRGIHKPRMNTKQRENLSASQW